MLVSTVSAHIYFIVDLVHFSKSSKNAFSKLNYKSTLNELHFKFISD